MVQIRFAVQLMSDMVLEHYFTIIKLVPFQTSTRALIDSLSLDGTSRDFLRDFSHIQTNQRKKNITLPSVFKITFYEIRIKEAISSMLSTKNCCFNFAIVRPTNNCDAGQWACSYFHIWIFLKMFSLYLCKSFDKFF